MGMKGREGKEDGAEVMGRWWRSLGSRQWYLSDSTQATRHGSAGANTGWPFSRSRSREGDTLSAAIAGRLFCSDRVILSVPTFAQDIAHREPTSCTLLYCIVARVMRRDGALEAWITLRRGSAPPVASPHHVPACVCQGLDHSLDTFALSAQFLRLQGTAGRNRSTLGPRILDRPASSC
nr:hypothetical protein CFP56_36228 [Quercus suber]